MLKTFERRRNREDRSTRRRCEVFFRATRVAPCLTNSRKSARGNKLIGHPASGCANQWFFVRSKKNRERFLIYRSHSLSVCRVSLPSRSDFPRTSPPLREAFELFRIDESRRRCFTKMFVLEIDWNGTTNASCLARDTHRWFTGSKGSVTRSRRDN